MGAARFHFKLPRLHFPIVQDLPVLKPKSGLSTRRLLRASRCNSKSPRLHFPIVLGLLVLKPKSGLSTWRPIGATRCHFKSSRIVQSLLIFKPKVD